MDTDNFFFKCLTIYSHLIRVYLCSSVDNFSAKFQNDFAETFVRFDVFVRFSDFFHRENFINIRFNFFAFEQRQNVRNKFCGRFGFFFASGARRKTVPMICRRFERAVPRLNSAFLPPTNPTKIKRPFRARLSRFAAK